MAIVLSLETETDILKFLRQGTVSRPSCVVFCSATSPVLFQHALTTQLQLSRRYTSKVCFARVDVGTVPSVLDALQLRHLPTFIVTHHNVEKRVEGFDLMKLAVALHGVITVATLPTVPSEADELQAALALSMDN